MPNHTRNISELLSAVRSLLDAALADAPLSRSLSEAINDVADAAHKLVSDVLTEIEK